MATERLTTFLVFATVLVLAPGPDFAVVLKNSLSGGRRSGFAASVGVTSSNVVHGTFAAFGIGTLIVRSQPVFQAVRWIGIAYLAYLGIQALSSAWRGHYDHFAGSDQPRERASAWLGWRQGFLSNITNPKVLTFYLSVLPQFMTAGSSTADGLLLAYTHAGLSLVWLVIVVASLHRLRPWLERRPVRRLLDAATGVALVFFGGRLALDGHQG